MLVPGVTLFFARHGETDWNLAQRYQGQQDIPLNATGRAQAARNGEALARTLAGVGDALDRVASPLLRARQTMEIVLRELALAPCAYRTDARLAEINYGHWEGQLWTQLPLSDPESPAASFFSSSIRRSAMARFHAASRPSGLPASASPGARTNTRS